MPVAAARYGRGPLLAKTRDTIGMQLRIVDRAAFLVMRLARKLPFERTTAS